MTSGAVPEKRGFVAALVTVGCLVAFGTVVLLGILAVGFVTGFRRTAVEEPPSDEQTLRDALAVPESARLVSLDADPLRGGTFGREGLRIVAVFQLEVAAVFFYRTARVAEPGWSELPIPDDVFSLRAPPSELPRGSTHGLYFCQTGVWRVGSELAHHPCVGAPEHVDQYRSAVLDEDTGRLTVVFKNYY